MHNAQFILLGWRWLPLGLCGPHPLNMVVRHGVLALKTLQRMQSWPVRAGLTVVAGLPSVTTFSITADLAFSGFLVLILSRHM